MTQGLLVTFQGPRSWPTRSSPAHSPLQEAARPPPSQALALCACPPLLVRRSPHHRCRQLASRRVQRAPPSSGCAGVAGQRLLPHHQRSSSSSRIGEKRGPRLKTRGRRHGFARQGQGHFPIGSRRFPLGFRFGRPHLLFRRTPSSGPSPTAVRTGAFKGRTATPPPQVSNPPQTSTMAKTEVRNGAPAATSLARTLSLTTLLATCWHRSPVVAALIHSGVPPLPMAAPPTHSPACSH